jgi:hypothetical protein
MYFVVVMLRYTFIENFQVSLQASIWSLFDLFAPIRFDFLISTLKLYLAHAETS